MGHACDGKITNTEMANEMVFLAHHGKVTLREKFPTKGWRYLPGDLPDADPHLSLGYSVVSPVYVADQLKAARASQTAAANEDDAPDLDLGEMAAAFEIDKKDLWRGTVEPASPAESWFVSATAAYWRMLDAFDTEDPEAASKELASELAALEARYLYTVSREQDLPALEAHRFVAAHQGHICSPPAPAIAGQRDLLRCDGGGSCPLPWERDVHQRVSRGG